MEYVRYDTVMQSYLIHALNGVIELSYWDPSWLPEILQSLNKQQMVVKCPLIDTENFIAFYLLVEALLKGDRKLVCVQLNSHDLKEDIQKKMRLAACPFTTGVGYIWDGMKYVILADDLSQDTIAFIDRMTPAHLIFIRQDKQESKEDYVRIEVSKLRDCIVVLQDLAQIFGYSKDKKYLAFVSLIKIFGCIKQEIKQPESNTPELMETGTPKPSESNTPRSTDSEYIFIDAQ